MQLLGKLAILGSRNGQIPTELIEHDVQIFGSWQVMNLCGRVLQV